MEAQVTAQPDQKTNAFRQPSPSIVRSANPGDMEDLIALMFEAASEQALFPVNENKARDMLNRAFNRQGGMIGVIGPKDGIEAAIYLMLCQPIYSFAWHIEEVFMVVRPAFRRSTHARSLIEFGKRCSDECAAAAGEPVPILQGVLHNKRTAAKVRLYRRQLGPPVGAFFLYGQPGYGLTPAE